MTHGKTYNKSPRRINHKATKSETNTGTSALERSVEQTTGGFKALLQLANFTLGPDATLNTEIHKNSVRIKAPNSVNASKRKHKNQINHYNKQRRELKSNIGQLETPDGSCTNEDSEKAEILNNCFASVFADEGSEVLPNFEERNFGETLSNFEINTVKISKAIVKLKASKSQGPDNIHTKFIKECKESLLKPLEIIFKKSLETGQIPDNLKQGNITAIFKSGSKTKAENYRPISLTSVPGKLCERLIRDEIVSHTERNNLWKN